MIQKPGYSNGVIKFNGEGDCIKNVPEEIWNMFFGGYQPLQKWLKDRRNEEIGKNEIDHYMHMITVLKETKEIMAEIDNIITV